jgi:hypothetical protein
MSALSPRRLHCDSMQAAIPSILFYSSAEPHRPLPLQPFSTTIVCPTPRIEEKQKALCNERLLAWQPWAVTQMLTSASSCVNIEPFTHIYSDLPCIMLEAATCTTRSFICRVQVDPCSSPRIRILIIPLLISYMVETLWISPCTCMFQFLNAVSLSLAVYQQHPVDLNSKTSSQLPSSHSSTCSPQDHPTDPKSPCSRSPTHARR